MRKFFIVLVLICFSVTGCSSGRKVRYTANYSTVIKETKTIAVMPPDLYIHQITAGKQIELMDDWTKQAKETLTKALKNNLDDRYGYEIKFIDKEWLKENHKSLWKDYKSLYSTVAKTLMVHAMGHGAHDFPTKKDVFDYTLGHGVSELSSAIDADMLFFIYGEEYYSTKGKMASELFVLLAAAALTGAIVMPMVVPDVIYFSVVNGKTGQIEWFKTYSGGILTRSLNDEKAISKVIQSIMTDMFSEEK